MVSKWIEFTVMASAGISLLAVRNDRIQRTLDFLRRDTLSPSSETSGLQSLDEPPVYEKYDHERCGYAGVLQRKGP